MVTSVPSEDLRLAVAALRLPKFALAELTQVVALEFASVKDRNQRVSSAPTRAFCCCTATAWRFSALFATGDGILDTQILPPTSLPDRLKNCKKVRGWWAVRFEKRMIRKPKSKSHLMVSIGNPVVLVPIQPGLVSSTCLPMHLNVWRNV